jgi:2-oxoglutarate ferredoxin oxidoreductase subunit alpha
MSKLKEKMAKELLTGNEVLVKGALASGATFLSGYPITPTTEILKYWAEETLKKPDLKFLQAEDEMAAGFNMIGAIMAGVKAFSTTAGPGNTLMQDAFSMAENMRLPTVAFIMQRGGPSTGTVIYSQQEVNLTCFGGNGEGLRVVYSTSGIQDLYDYSIKSFNTAWRYRFPTFLLGDGYQSKELAEVNIYNPSEQNIDITEATPYLLKPKREPGHFSNYRNTYNLEEELSNLIMHHKKAYNEITPEIIEYEDIHTLDAEVVIFAHGIVAAVAKVAQEELRKNGIKVGVFRPITLVPFPRESAQQAIKNKKTILIVESSLGQFANIVKSHICGDGPLQIEKLACPALAVSQESIIKKIKEMLKKE